MTKIIIIIPNIYKHFSLFVFFALKIPLSSFLLQNLKNHYFSLLRSHRRSPILATIHRRFGSNSRRISILQPKQPLSIIIQSLTELHTLQFSISSGIDQLDFGQGL
ncbi:hypothetical protein Lal_00009905 [Lupinus albus]|nr:hypothetical protein Lal_00009905 [Lupinus albus]